MRRAGISRPRKTKGSTVVWCRDETVALALAPSRVRESQQATLYFRKRVANRIRGLHDHELGQQIDLGKCRFML